MKPRLLLIDADIVTYHSSILSQQETAFGTAVFEQDAEEHVDKTVKDLMLELKADKVIVCLTPTGSNKNFRLSVLPSYKQHRKTVERPELLEQMKSYIAREYDSRLTTNIEADDLLGIYATDPEFYPEYDKIIVSQDKDLRTIPGLLYNPGKPEVGLIDVSPLDADRFLCWQTIVGDTADGYSGAPRVGKESVYAHDIVFADREELWDEVLMAYASRGLSETHAIQQARCARILRHGEYNFETEEVTLFEPEMLYFAD